MQSQIPQACNSAPAVAQAPTSTPGTALAQAIAAERAGDHEAAIRGFTGVLQRDPGSVAALCGLGRVMLGIESYQEGLVCLEKALLIDPQHAESHYRSGIALALLGRGPEAIERFDRVLRLDPDHLDAQYRRAAALADLARFDEALMGLDRLFALLPNDVAVLNARAFALEGLGRLQSALAAYDRVLAINPEHPGARRRRSFIYLAHGKLLEGFRDHEYRWQEQQTYANRQRLTHLITLPLNTSAPLWLGDAPLGGKTLLLHHEQGLGDTLHFVRYAALAAALGARVILGVPPSLRRLLQAMPAVADVTIRTDALPAHDFHCPMMSLPLAFRTTLDSIPANIPYLQADPQDTAAWAQRLGPATRPRIGLVWACGAYPPGRAIALELLRPLLALDADFISVQKELGDGDSGRLAELGIAHRGELLEDFADTAALIQNLDLLISVDTSTAHLAGALGKPVWVLLKFPADWRWLLGRDDSPWYPTARLFRQPTLGDWAPVVEQVRRALSELVATQGSALISL
jgi:tetratricopeptide (TPR) repeat protein